MKRDVVFLGIERIVPHSEKSQSISYSKSFSDQGKSGWENEVKDTVGKILGKNYENFQFVSHSKYRLPLVVSNKQTYSGFNMGAGENALFEVFSIMHSISEGALIVIDEIELGLHSEAQKKFIHHLKLLSEKRKIQIICTTHSKEIFGQLPDEARLFVESINGESIVTHSISPDFAFSKLSAENQLELCLLVEDSVAKSLMCAVLPSSIRLRISIESIGSASALSRQLAASFLRQKEENIVILFDGDQKPKESTNLTHAYKMTESTKEKKEIIDWMEARVEYLPGDTWPEAWILEKCTQCLDFLAPLIGINENELADIIKQGMNAGKHKEFFEIGKLVGLDEETTLDRFCIAISQNHSDEFNNLIESLNKRLN